MLTALHTLLLMATSFLIGMLTNSVYWATVWFCFYLCAVFAYLIVGLVRSDKQRDHDDRVTLLSQQLEESQQRMLALETEVEFLKGLKQVDKVDISDQQELR